MKNGSRITRPARRIEPLEPYFFHHLNQKITAMRQGGMEIIRLDMGSPDLPPALFIIDALVQGAKQDHSHGYAPYGGTAAFKQAAATYYKNRFGVELDPAREVLGLIGSKEGIFNLTQAVVNPEDFVLVPDPGYPTYRASAEIAGAGVYAMPLLAENGYLPDLDAIPPEVARTARILWINYPNNPTGASASLDDLKVVVDFGREHDILIAHDAPYVDTCYDSFRPPSILQVEGARDVAVEFTSLSKTYNMAGWRLGIAAGNPEILYYLNLYKTLADNSTFLPLLSAGTAALSGSQEWLAQRNQVYQARRDAAAVGLLAMGFTLQMPKASLYVWAKIPHNYEDSLAFCARILENSGVSLTPGIIFGEHGEGYIRVSLCTPEQEITSAMQRVRNYLTQIKP